MGVFRAKVLGSLLSVTMLGACSSGSGGGAPDTDASVPGPDASRHSSASERCGNGIDDDGDGRIDDGCPCGPGEVQACFTGAHPSRGVGICRDGVQRCELEASGGEWGDWGDYPCVGAVEPESERCDGMDNDCDGAVDNDCPCTAGEERACGGDIVAPPCEGGTQVCREDGTWSDCEGAVTPEPESCEDGVDNDCNGVVDDGCGCEPEPETCGDGVDNDCDGVADERCERCECDGAYDTVSTADVGVGVFGVDLGLQTTDWDEADAQLGFLSKEGGDPTDDSDATITFGRLEADGTAALAPVSIASVHDSGTRQGGPASLVSLGSRWLAFYGDYPDGQISAGFGLVLDDSGTVVGGPTRISGEPGVHAGAPIAIAGRGEVHVVWSQCRPEAMTEDGYCRGGNDLFYRRYDRDLSPLGPRVRVTDTPRKKASPQALALGGGRVGILSGEIAYEDAEATIHEGTNALFAIIESDAVVHRWRKTLHVGSARLIHMALATSASDFLLCWNKVHRRGETWEPAFCQRMTFDGSLSGPELAVGPPGQWGVSAIDDGCGFVVATVRPHVVRGDTHDYYEHHLSQLPHDGSAPTTTRIADSDYFGSRLFAGGSAASLMHVAIGRIAPLSCGGG